MEMDETRTIEEVQEEIIKTIRDVKDIDVLEYYETFIKLSLATWRKPHVDTIYRE